LCRNEDAATCPTAAQVEAVRSPGGWSGCFVGKSEPARLDFWRYWVIGDSGWDPRTFDFVVRDLARAESALPAATATIPT
jgi:feruloyl esterase